MKVGIFQSNPVFGAVSQNLDRAIELISSENADLWVFPELFNTGYQFISKKEVRDLSEPVPSGPTTQRLIKAAKRLKTTIVAGLAELDGQACYNSAVLVGPKGFVAVYRKIHLFYEENRWFTPGNRPFQVIPITYKSKKGGRLTCRVGMMICFDWIFPESARTLTLMGADVICHPSNLVLPHCPDAMITRCLENRVFAVTANRVGAESRGLESRKLKSQPLKSKKKETLRFIGRSQIVTPDGKMLCRASEKDEAVHVVTIDPKQARNKSINRYNDLIKNRAEHFYT